MHNNHKGARCILRMPTPPFPVTPRTFVRGHWKSKVATFMMTPIHHCVLCCIPDTQRGGLSKRTWLLLSSTADQAGRVLLRQGVPQPIRGNDHEGTARSCYHLPAKATQQAMHTAEWETEPRPNSRPCTLLSRKQNQGQTAGHAHY